jgi:hedgehog
LVALSNGSFKFAYKLTTNDSILIYDSKMNKSIIETIVSIRIGLVDAYSAPVTQLGTILVNDILISCYALIESHSLAHLVMSPIRIIYSFNKLYQNLLPTNNSSSSSSSYYGEIMRINKQSNGIHWYPELLYFITSKLNLI